MASSHITSLPTLPTPSTSYTEPDRQMFLGVQACAVARLLISPPLHAWSSIVSGLWSVPISDFCQGQEVSFVADSW